MNSGQQLLIETSALQTTLLANLILLMKVCAYQTEKQASPISCVLKQSIKLCTRLACVVHVSYVIIPKSCVVYEFEQPCPQIQFIKLHYQIT